MSRIVGRCLLVAAIAISSPAVATAQGGAGKKSKSAPPSRTANKSSGAAKVDGKRAASKADDDSAAGPALPSGRPGDRRLSGVQTPSIIVEKIAPLEVQIGKAARFEVRVRNVGDVTIHGVEVHDEVPAGAELASTEPEAKVDGQRIVWSVGDLAPGAEEIVAMSLLPTEEGEIGSLATVRFAAQATSKSRVTRPQLKLDVISPREVLIGEDVQVTIRVSNPGTGPATGVVLTEVVPTNCLHDEGPELEQEVGDLKPGETREFPLTLRAAKAGQANNLVHVAGDGRLKAERISPLTVLAPALEVNVEGPKRRYLERQATYTVEISNPGTAPARDVELAVILPKGLKFEEADNNGEYDPQTRSVRWSRDELQANVTDTVKVVTRPVEPGEHKLRVEGSGSNGLQTAQEKQVLVQGVAGTSFEVVDVADAIEVGEETEYEIGVINKGTKDDSMVVLTLVLPPGLKAVSADGPTEHVMQGSEVRFAPLDRLAPRERNTYRVRVEGKAAGDQRVRAQLRSAELKTPLTKEESTRVYSDDELADPDDESDTSPEDSTTDDTSAEAEDAFAGDEEDDGEEPTVADDEFAGDDTEDEGSAEAEDEPTEAATATARNRRRMADE